MDLPKPVHGMSNVNLAVLNKTLKLGLKPTVINTVPSYAARFFMSKYWGVFKLTHTFLCYFYMFFKLLFNFGGVVYRPINGGTGQVYDLVYIAICRVFFQKIFIHHHSFNYLNDHSSLFSVLNKIAGSATTHIVLGPKMGEKLTEHYGINKEKIRVVSNLAFFETVNNVEKRDTTNTVVLGHLANLCLEKGIALFLKVCSNLELLQIDFVAKIAGPFADDDAKKMVLEAVAVNPNIKYLGPLYEEDKLEFYKSLDCFIFPSMYKNEAEPLVLYEAALNGVFLAGTRKGCMKDVIESLSGFSVLETPSSDIAKEIAKSIKFQFDNQGFDLDKKTKRLVDFENEKVKAKEALIAFIDDMRNYDIPKVK
ncbi:glycosyltransferase family 4 protein [Pseudoalteromonas marina]|uniref:glycosyltransferase family 4 protein n=1 Tax=Pseudoalteromonas marina TaxID=267375 RepID=UPI00026CEA28|nr:glycosyltransferase family 4 protein [Pseudoalteromonas marina]